VRVRIVPGGRERIERIGVVTGGGADLIGAAAAAGLDALITGEGPHHSFFDAMEGGLTVYYGGHYATEVFGVKALAERLETAFGLPWEFLELPTGF
jgi:putative NIF3 family GTP cyclohydrolase 1 type 2